MLAPIAEKISKRFTTYVDLRLRRFEPNFPRSATLNIEKHARCGRTAGRVRGPPCIPVLHAHTEDMEAIFLQSSQSLSAKREHFGLIATELKNGCQVADVGEID